MTARFDAKRLFNDVDAVAAVVPASEVFSLLTRALDLPPAWAALVGDVQGGQRFFAPGEVVPRENADELLLVRVTPIDLRVQESGLVSRDKYQFDAEVRVRVALIADRGELSSFQNTALGSKRTATSDTLAQLLRPDIRSALIDVVGESNAETLITDADRHTWSDRLNAALKPVCFRAGLAVDAAPSVRFDSPTFRQVRVSQEQTARHQAEHQARRQLEQAIEAAQVEHLDHLESLLARLKDAADSSPDVELPELMRTFSQRERGEMYEALFAADSVQATRWIVVATSDGLYWFDPASPGEPARAVDVVPEVGGIRSVHCLRSSASDQRLLLGAARGVYEFVPEGTDPAAIYVADRQREVRGGFNAVALAGRQLWASHSELGLVRWDRTAPDRPEPVLESQTQAARAVRGVLFHEGKIWVSLDDRVASLPADAPGSEPDWYTGSEATITALAVTPGGVLGGTADGRILHWRFDEPRAPQTLHTGNRRSVESIHVLSTGGVDRLFFTDTSLAVHARVRGDSFTCRYEAGGQTLRRVEVMPDLIVATNDVRDRLVCWSPSRPDQPRAVIPVARLTHHSVQDVCLVPTA